MYVYITTIYIILYIYRERYIVYIVYICNYILYSCSASTLTCWGQEAVAACRRAKADFVFQCYLAQEGGVLHGAAGWQEVLTGTGVGIASQPTWPEFGETWGLKGLDGGKRPEDRYRCSTRWCSMWAQARYRRSQRNYSQTPFTSRPFGLYW